MTEVDKQTDLKGQQSFILFYLFSYLCFTIYGYMWWTLPPF